MSRKLEVASDPRTIAREISGVFDATFPQLAPAIVAHFNRSYSRVIKAALPVDNETLESSSLQRAMLFELAIAAAEDMLSRRSIINWDECLGRAGARQRRFFDAEVPPAVNAADRKVAKQVAVNLLAGLEEIANSDGQSVIASPQIPGFRWIATGVGDFSTEKTIIEIKCSSKRFSTADYRQIVIYWLLKHIHSAEFSDTSWKKGVLINPRLCILVEFPFKDLVELIAHDKSISVIVDSFCSIVSEGPEIDLSNNEYELGSWPNA